MSENEITSNYPDKVQSFLHLHSSCQHRIYGFIMSFVADWNEADDIYQDTLSVLWRRFDEYVPGTDFLSWSFAIARYQILSHQKKQKTRRKYFSSATLANLQDVAAASVKDTDRSLAALRKCIRELSERSKHLLSLRYEDGASVQKIAQRVQTSAHTLYKQYRRIHAQLFRCMRKQLEWD